MPLLRLALHTAAALALATGMAAATPYGDDEDEPHVPGPVRDLFLVRGADNPAERAMRTDLAFTRNMARHHRGAIDMAVYYLGDPRGTNPVLRRLAQAIVHNQAFEIGVLEVVERDVARGPRPVRGVPRLVALNRGWHGLEHERRFVKAPAPGVLDLWVSRGAGASAFDVQFARPMIDHHRAAVAMSLAYNRHPDGGNSVLGPLNHDIVVDQRTEIDLLRHVVARYPGDPATVADDARMMEIMRRSMAGMDGPGRQDGGGQDGGRQDGGRHGAGHSGH